jgi:ATP-binding cassette, subfamily B, multidrug efflux pump
MTFIFNLLKPYKIRLIFALLLKSIAALADLMIPFLIAYMIDTQIPALNETDGLTPLYLNGGLMVLIALFGWILNVISNRSSEYIASKAVETLRSDLFSSIEKLSAHDVDVLSKPSLISRMTTDTYNIYRAAAIIQRLGIRAPVLLIGGILLSFSFDAVLTLVMVLMLPFVSIIIYQASKKGIPLYKKNQFLMDQLIRKLREFITGARVVRALSMNDHEMEQFKNINQTSNESELYANKVMARVNPMMNIVMNIGLVIVLVIGAYRLNLGFTKIGAIMAFVTYFTIILNAMMGITRIFVLSSRAAASSERIEEVLNQEIEVQEGTESYQIDTRFPHIEFNHVSFSYLKKTQQLKDISFQLFKGQKLGIIGATGSGKSTIAKLLLRFYDADEGDIKIYGKDIKSYTLHALRNQIGAVLQQDMIFNEDIAFNVSLHHNQKEVEKALNHAQASFVYEKEEGIHTNLTTSGTNISGGQKQRLLIARALYKNPDLLILDDASSALDYQTDQKLRKTLHEDYQDTTMVIIAQRIASIKHCDLILYLDQGKIIDAGTHEALMKKHPSYQAIVKHQLGGVAL